MGSESVSDELSSQGDREAKRVATTKGASFFIHLWEDRTRGELWVPVYEPTTVALVNDEFLRIASNNAVDAGRRTFEFQALVAGSHRLIFEKRMGWKFTSEDRRVFLVVASEDGTPASDA